MRVRALVALAFAWVIVAAVPAAAQESGKTALKLGWAQDPQTLNPFVGQDEEDFRVWAINWDLLVNFSPKDLSPAPGHRQELGRLRRQEDGHVPARSRTRSGPTASRSPPTDVKYSLDDARRPTALLFTQLHDNVTKIDTPDADTVVVHTKRPDARIVGGLFIYILPEAHLGQGAGQGAHRLVPARAAARRQRPVRRHRLRARPDHHDGAQPELPRAEAELRRDPVHQVRQPGRRRAGAPARRDRPRPRGRSRRASRGSATQTNIETVAGRLAVVHAARVQPLPEADLPGREVQPGGPGPRPCARRSPTRSTASGSTRSPPAAPRSSATGSCPSFYKSFYEQPAQDYPLRPRQGEPDPRRRRLEDGRRRRPRRRAARSSRSTSTCARSRRTTSRRRSSSPRRPRPIGVDFNVQVVSTDKLYDLTVAEGERQAGAGLRHVHLGLGRRPVRPELPAQHPDHRARSAAPPTRSTRTPSTTSSTSSRPASSTPPSARRSSSGWSRSPSATCPTSC